MRKITASFVLIAFILSAGIAYANAVAENGIANTERPSLKDYPSYKIFEDDIRTDRLLDG